MKGSAQPFSCLFDNSRLSWFYLGPINNDSGNEISRVHYSPYGAIIEQSGSLPTDRLYTGQRFEASLDLYDYRARFYDPLTANFISADTMVPNPGSPVDWNRFAYVRGNPVRYSDPSGHCVFGLDTAVCIVAALAGAGLLLSADAPLHPDEAPSAEQGLLGLGLLTLPIAPYAYGAAEPYIYLYGDRIFRASQTPGGQIAGNAAEEVIDDCLDGCTPESALGSAVQGAILGEAVSGRLEYINPTKLRWTQRTAGGRGRAAVLRKSMAERGWDGSPIDVVRTSDGLVTVDHTRAVVALELGINSIPVRIHLPSDPLPVDMIGRFGPAHTWGEAIAYRAANQRPPLPPTGTTEIPRMSR